MEKINKSDNNDIFTTHYYFNDKSHQMDAFVRNRCEYKLISSFFYCFDHYGIRAKLESLPKEEGGLIDFLKVVSDYKDHIEILLMSLTTLFTGYPFFRNLLPDEEKELTKKKVLLQIKKLEEELNESASREEIHYSAKELVENLAKDKSFVYLLSEYFQTLIKEEKITKVGFGWKNNESIISNENFEKLIVAPPKTVENPPEIITIELVSPVLKNKRFKWKGIIDGETRNFTMKDQKFSKLVRERAFSFQNGDSITASVVKFGEVDFNGDWSKIEFNVIKVHSVYCAGINIKVDTPMPEKAVLDQHQWGLFPPKEK